MCVNILYATDQNYVPIMGTSICSLLNNNKDLKNIHIYILEENVGEEEKNKICELITSYNREVSFIAVDKIIRYFEENRIPKYCGHFSPYIRLYAGEALKEIDKCLYIDCDTVIVGNLKELWDINLTESPAAAAIDCNHSAANYALHKSKKEKYYNSGIMLINLKIWRDEHYFDKFIQASKKFDLGKTLTNSDQELINYMLGNKIITIPLKYNVSSYYRIKARSKLMWICDKTPDNFYDKREIVEAVNNPVILHFTGGSWGRPWFSNSKDSECNKWVHYLKMTPWKDYERKKYEVNSWKKFCIMSEKILPIWMFAILKRLQGRIKIWRKCGV